MVFNVTADDACIYYGALSSYNPLMEKMQIPKLEL